METRKKTFFRPLASRSFFKFLSWNARYPEATSSDELARFHWKQRHRSLNDVSREILDFYFFFAHNFVWSKIEIVVRSIISTFSYRENSFLRHWDKLDRDDSRDLSRSLLCTVPYGSHAQWRIVNAVKVTRRKNRVDGAGLTSPCERVPAGHVPRFSPPYDRLPVWADLRTPPNDFARWGKVWSFFDETS